jgi:RimJ/RimL family protein N-acetyltransferase
MKKEIILKKITKNDHIFLYELLESRDPKINISHKSMPSFKEHVKFVKSKPYISWYVIIFEKSKIGSVYLSKQNEIGIFVLKEFRGNKFGQLALNKLIEMNPCDRYLANVGPKNLKSIDFFKNNKFKLIQHTYELTSRKKSHEEKN